VWLWQRAGPQPDPNTNLRSIPEFPTAAAASTATGSDRVQATSASVDSGGRPADVRGTRGFQPR
jgi:hypothetical protein